MLIYQKIKKFLPAILGLVLILVLIFLTWPEYQKFNAVSIEVKNKQQKLENHQKNLELLKSIKDINKIDKILPDEPEIPELMVQVEALAQKSGLILKTIDFKKGDGEITSNIKTAGSYQAFKKYLKFLESNLRLIDVVNISFESPEQGNFYNFSLTIKSYYGSRQKTENTAD